MQALMAEIAQEYLRSEIPDFAIGDTVDVHVKIREGEKERIQIFNGTVIRRRGSGISETFTVRRIVQGEGVERIFPIHSPNVVDVTVKKRGRVRRAKLYYLRDRVGKGTRVREKIWVKPTKKAEEVQAKPEAEGTPEERAKAAEEAEKKKAADRKKAAADRRGKKKDKKAKRREAKKKKKPATKSDD